MHVDVILHIIITTLLCPSPDATYNFITPKMKDWCNPALLFCTCVSTYIRQLSSFRAPTLCFIDLTLATCHIQYTFISLFQFISRENEEKKTIILGVRHFVWYENGRWRLLGAQSINTDRASWTAGIQQCCHNSPAQVLRQPVNWHSVNWHYNGTSKLVIGMLVW